MKTRIYYASQSFNHLLLCSPHSHQHTADIPLAQKGPGYVTALGGIYKKLDSAGRHAEAGFPSPRRMC